MNKYKVELSQDEMRKKLEESTSIRAARTSGDPKSASTSKKKSKRQQNQQEYRDQKKQNPKKPKEYDLSSVGGRIKQALAARCITQEDLAGELGVNAGVVSRILNNLREPTYYQLHDLCEYLEISADYVMFGKDTPVLSPQAIKNILELAEELRSCQNDN